MDYFLNWRKTVSSGFLIFGCLFLATQASAQTSQLAIETEQCHISEWGRVTEAMGKDFPHLNNTYLGIALVLRSEVLAPYIESNCIELNSEKILCRILITQSLKKVLIGDEFLAVIAHEVGHAAYKDYDLENPGERSLRIEKRADLFALIALKRMGAEQSALLSALARLRDISSNKKAKKEMDERIAYLKQLPKN